MGIRIIEGNKAETVIEPFTRQQLRERKVRCWCDLQTHQHNLIYGTVGGKRSGSDPGFSIEFSPATFCSLIKTGNDHLKEFAEKTKGSRPVLFSPLHLTLDADMHQCIYGIMNYREDEDLKCLYLYARVIDLLRLQQKSYLRTITTQPVHLKTEYDKERIVFARDYLITHMDAPPSLTRLAGIAGMNEFKLKRGFKEMFNHTVFGYLADLRLEMARTALQKKQKNITQIAFELGYASLQHFSASFKKKFGVSPAKFG